MNHIEATIMGQSYRLSCPPGAEGRMADAVGRVDGAMCKIRDGGRVKARDKIAVLAALNISFELADRISELETAPAPQAAPADAAPASTTGGASWAPNDAWRTSEPVTAVAPEAGADSLAAQAQLASPATQMRWAALLERLDQVLGEDGRLF